MVIENLQITPLAEWVLGAGWYNGWLWTPMGIALLVAILLGGGCGLIIALRRRTGRPGPGVSLWTGSILGGLVLMVLAAVVMCATPVTRKVLVDYVGKPLFNSLSPVLGNESTPPKDPAQEQEEAQSKDSKKDQAQTDTPPGRNWTSGALYTWLGALIGLLSLIYFISWLVSVLVSGPALGTEQCGRAVLEIAGDIARISPRRVFALAWLAWRESIRRRVVVVFVVFVLIILFAALFMKKDSLHPSQLYITVVLNCTVALTMLFALVLSSLSLPADLRDRTLHTVVTKPVRKIEIVLGRVLGFTAVGTALLAAIGLISYGFTVRSLRHTHQLTSDMLHTEKLPGGRTLLVGETSESHGHNHRVTVRDHKRVIERLDRTMDNLKKAVDEIRGGNLKKADDDIRVAMTDSQETEKRIDAGTPAGADMDRSKNPDGKEKDAAEPATPIPQEARQHLERAIQALAAAKPSEAQREVAAAVREIEAAVQRFKEDYTVEMKQDHDHVLEIEYKPDGTTVYRLGPPEGQFQARVPIYGKLTFTDKTGKLKNQERGINVGDEWTYRSFIQGRTNAMATWLFSDLHKEKFPEEQFSGGIPVEMTIEVFRTHKGNMEKGVAGTIFLENPKTKKRVTLENFTAEKFATDRHMIPLHFSRAGRDGKIEKIDLFKDLVSDDGQLAVSIQCLENGQCFGMAQPDLYIRAADGTFEWNFVKAYTGIWLQMVLVLSLGVMFSTFVSGPVALLATVFVVIIGVFSSYLVELGTGKMVGGGPFEAFERITTQDNMTSELQPGVKTSVEKAMDEGAAVVMRYISAVVPEFHECSFGRHLAFGFDVGLKLLLRCIIREIGFVLPVLLLGYIALKQREIAQ